MIRHGVLATALAVTAARVGLVEKPVLVLHGRLEEKFDGPDLLSRTRGAVGAGHRPAAERPMPQRCTFVRKPGKRARRRARGKARSR